MHHGNCINAYRRHRWRKQLPRQHEITHSLYLTRRLSPELDLVLSIKKQKKKLKLFRCRLPMNFISSFIYKKIFKFYHDFRVDFFSSIFAEIILLQRHDKSK